MSLATHTREDFDFVGYAAADLARARAAELTAANDPEYDKGCTEVQRKVLETKAKRFALLWGRRTGKTHVIPRLLLRSAAEPETWSVYLTKTRKNAKLLLWRWLKKAAHELGIRHTTNETDLVLEVEGGGSILLGGADDLAAIERWRQFGWKLAILDEMGVLAKVPDLLVTLVDDVIAPAAADFEDGGTIVFSGTPGYILDGRWYELSGPDSRIEVIRADARSNTAKPWIWKNLLEEKAKNGWADDHPTWLREGLGIWVQDASSLVYPYDDERNGIDGLPTHTTTGVPLHASGWRYVLAIDVGYVHSTAFALLACHELDPRDFIVETEQHKEMLPEDVIEHVRKVYQPRFPWLPIVVDSGGMGKIHAVTMRRRGQLPVEAAEKRDKPDAVRDLRGRLLSGHTKVLRGPQNDCVRSCWSRLGWDDKREAHSKEQEDDAADAVLYGARKLHNFREHAPPMPQPPTPQEVAAKMKAEQIRRYQPKQHPWASGGEW